MKKNKVEQTGEVSGKKVLISATVLSHIGQFHRPLGDLLHSYGFEVHVAGSDNLSQKNGLSVDWADKVYDVPFSRSPRSRDNIRAYKILKRIIEDEGYSYVHCNTPMGGIVSRLAARRLRKRGGRVVYTAHGFHFHKRASKLAWLVYYPIERIFARFTDMLITINREDYALAQRKFGCSVHYTHGVGVNCERYVPSRDEEERQSLCSELGIGQDRKVILAIGELLPNKNQKMIVSAMGEISRRVPEALLVIAGNGPLKESLEAQCREEGVEGCVRLIGYCTELEKYQKVASVLAACSYREGLPLNLVEAMLSENPIVATHNRGHDELVRDGETGYLVEPDDVSGMATRIVELLSDHKKCSEFGQRARNIALDYSYDNVKRELKEVYGL